MAEYIEREKVYKMLHSFGGCGAEYGGCGAEPKSWADGWDKAIDTAISELGDIPTADVRPEMHGFWKECTNGTAWWYECSECNHIPNIEGKTPFCLRCGAKMGGEGGDNNEKTNRT